MQTAGQSRCSCYTDNSDWLFPRTLGLVVAVSISDLEKGICTPKSSITASDVHAGLIKTTTALPLLTISFFIEMSYLLSASQPSGDNRSAESGMFLFALFVCVYIACLLSLF